MTHHVYRDVGAERSIRADRALEALYSERRYRPVITWVFLGLCLAVTIPTLLDPSLYDVLGGLEPRRHFWQPFSAVFEHGWPGFHGAMHLGLNAFLILEIGRPCERLLGSSRFLGLVLLAVLSGAAAQSLTDGFNGSSVVIWAWGPPLFVAMQWVKRQGATDTPDYQRLRGVLFVMYVVVTLIMGALPLLTGETAMPLEALLMGNLHHIVATAVGTVFAVLTADRIRDRMVILARG